jgi:hypothetical protein
LCLALVNSSECAGNKVIAAGFTFSFIGMSTSISIFKPGIVYDLT